jgi:HK97 family phage major capsid protein
MNRKTLMAVLRDGYGYKGADELPEIQKFIADENLDLRDEQGKAVDVAQVWITPAAKRAVVLPSAKEEATPRNDEAVTKAASLAAGKTIEAPAIRSKAEKDRALYQKKINAKTAIYSAPEEAEEFGAFIRFNAMGGKDYSQKANDREILVKAGATTVNSTGGALVPEAFNAQLIWLTENYGASRRLANVVTLPTDVNYWPRKTALGAGAFIDENGTFTATDNTYDNVALNPKLFGVLARLSNSLLEDSAVNIADDYSRSFAETYSITMDNCYFNAAGQPAYGNMIGLNNSTNVTSVTASGASAEAIVAADITKLMGTPANAGQNPNWAFVMSRQVFVRSLARIGLAAGGTTAIEYTNGAIVNGLRTDAMFLGFPVIFAQVMDTTGGSGLTQMYFGDFQASTMIGIRRDLRIKTSTERYFDQDQFAILGTSRFGVNIHGSGRSGNDPIAKLVTT